MESVGIGFQFFRKEVRSGARDGNRGGEAAGARTRDPRLKRPLLYQLSYRPPTADRRTQPIMPVPTVNFRVAASRPVPMRRPSASPHDAVSRRPRARRLGYTGSVAGTQTGIVFRNQDALPVPSTESLRRPLTDEEKREIWGDRGGSVSREVLEELERMLQTGDAESRALAEACVHALIFQAMSDRMLDPRNGYVSQFNNQTT